MQRVQDWLIHCIHGKLRLSWNSLKLKGAVAHFSQCSTCDLEALVEALPGSLCCVIEQETSSSALIVPVTIQTQENLPT